MFTVVGFHGCLQIGQTIVCLFVNRHINLRGRRPEDDDTVAVSRLLKLTDILTKRLYHLPTSLTVLHMIAVKTLGIVLVEGSLHRNNLLQFVTHRVDILFLQYLGIYRSLIGVLRINIPTAKDDVRELGHRHDLLIAQILFLCTLSYSDTVILCHRSHWLCQSLAGHQHSCHKRGGNSTVAYYQNTQFALCRQHVRLFHIIICFSCSLSCSCLYRIYP